MSSVIHHAIVVTSWKEPALVELVALAGKLGATVAGPSAEAINGYRTVVVCPDGSKEGWDDSDNGDAHREKIKSWLNTQRHEDGSSWLEWVEVEYGNDLYGEGESPSITDDQWRNR